MSGQFAACLVASVNQLHDQQSLGRLFLVAGFPFLAVKLLARRELLVRVEGSFAQMTFLVRVVVNALTWLRDGGMEGMERGEGEGR